MSSIVLATCINQQDEHGRRLQLQPQSKLLRLTRLCQQALQRPHSSIMHVLSWPPLRFRAVNIGCKFLQSKASSVLTLSGGLARHCQFASWARLSLFGRSSVCDKLLAKRQASKAVSKSHTCVSIREAKWTAKLANLCSTSSRSWQYQLRKCTLALTGLTSLTSFTLNRMPTLEGPPALPAS